MFGTSIKNIKQSVRTGLSRLKKSSVDPTHLRVVDLGSGQVTLSDGSRVLVRSRQPYNHPKLFPIQCHSTPFPEHRDSLYSLKSSSFEQYDSPLVIETSPTINNVSEQTLSPNTRLFRGSQDDFGFDVYIPHDETRHEPAYLFECPTIIPWGDLVYALAKESDRDGKDIVLCSRFYPHIVDDETSYHSWLLWSREQDGPCSTDLWLK